MKTQKVFQIRAKLLIKRALGTIVLFIVVLSNRFVQVRIGRINNKVIGHFAMELDASTLLNKKFVTEKPHLNLYYFAHSVSINKYFEQLVKERFKVMPQMLLEYAYQFMLANETLHEHVISSYDYNLGVTIPASKKLDSNFWMELSSEPPLLHNGLDEKQDSKKLLLELGSKYEEFACFHVRDSMFKTNELRDRGFSSWHIEENAKRSDFRNSEINNFMMAAKYLSSKKIAPIRVGKNMKIINDPTNSFFVDYSYSGLRSDRSDLLLAANCKFMVCTLSGFSEVSKIFRVPIFYIDLGEFTYFASKVNSSVKATPVVLPKIIRFKQNQKILSFAEIKDLNLYEKSTIQFEQYLGDPHCPIKLENNSPEVVLKSIELGLNHLEKKCSNLENQFQRGQMLFSKLYDLKASLEVPAISPYWPNASEFI